MAKLTTEEFIKKAQAVHGDRYDYSKVKYVGSESKVCIICNEHGEYWQAPHTHLRGSGCPICVGRAKMRTTDFVKRAKSIHGDKYDYSKAKHKGVFNKIRIICPTHGEFWQSAHVHLRGAGCPQCGKIQSDLSRQKTSQEFIEQARKVHGDRYDYSKIEYKGIKNKVVIVCPQHGAFLQIPSNHLNGAGCPICKKERVASSQRKTTEYFLQEAHKVHGDRYDYSKTKYHGAGIKVCIICKNHGEFWQLPSNHLKGHGCIKCSIEKSTKYNKEICVATARTCNSRVEFFNKYPGIVDCAKRNGWYEECCLHMGEKGDKQRIIYAYEFDEAHAAYIGLTFKMEVRNKRHHREGAVYDFAALHGFDIPEPKVLTDYMDQNEASIQEGVWLQKYKDDGWIILNRFKTGSLGGQEVLDYDIAKIEESMQGFTKLNDWERSYSSYRVYLSQHKLDYLLDKHIPNRMRRVYDDYEECRKAYSLCKSITEVHERFPGAIAAAKRHGWHKELSEICRSTNIRYTREVYIELISKYKTLKEFRHEQHGAYARIRHNGWEDLLLPLKRQLHSDYNYTIEDILSLCNEAGDYNTLKTTHPEVPNYCWHKGIDIYELTGWKRSNRCPIRLLKDGEVVAAFPSAKAAAIFVGVDNRHLGRYIDKGIEYRGYVWETDK